MRSSLLPLALFFLLAPSTVLAQEPPKPDPSAQLTEQDQERARERYQRGAKAYEAGRYQEAINLFLEAARFVPNPALAYNVGLAYEALGNVSKALSYYREYLRQLPEAEDRAEVEEGVRRLEQELQARGVQQVTIMSEPEGASVLIDDKSVGITPWTGEIAPGKHTVLLQLRGYADGKLKFTLGPDRAMDVSLALNEAKSLQTEPEPARPAPPPPPAAPAAEPARDQVEIGGVATLTWLTLGAGVATLGGALAFELLRSQAENDARDAPTQIEAADKIDTRDSHRDMARILTGVGGALTLGGGVMLVIDLSSGGGAPAEPAGAFGFGCSADGCAAVARGVF